VTATTRRDFLRDAAFAGGSAAAFAAGAAPVAAALPGRTRRARREVAVLGGGVGGLTAAHELVERGFRVTVYEKQAWGGKARSIPVPHTAHGERRPLPGENGARFFSGSYENLPETMRRIPFGSDPDGTYGNIVVATQERVSRSGGREDTILPYSPDPSHWTADEVRRNLLSLFAGQAPPQETAYFVDRLMVFLTSCQARRFGEWEHMTWAEFTHADSLSESYRKTWVEGVPHFVLAAKAREACARTVGRVWEIGLYAYSGRARNGGFDQVLNAPTNEVWIDPWVRRLRKLGVRFRRPVTVTGLEMRRGRIASAIAHGPRGREEIDADWYVCALPVERARRLWDRRVLAADPALEMTKHLETRWMNGFQFFLREQVPIVHGHCLYVDSPWALSSVSQAQFWSHRDFHRDYGDGSVRECVSVDIADFGEPGRLYGKTARELPPARMAHEIWTEMKAHLNDSGQQVLRDDMIHSYFFEAARGNRPPRRSDEDPLFISTPGAWAKRPGARTAIPNLFLASDYVRVDVDTASMEGANMAARMATNALLDAAGSSARRAEVQQLYHWPEFDELRRADEVRYRAGQPNAFDAPPIR